MKKIIEIDMESQSVESAIELVKKSYEENSNNKFFERNRKYIFEILDNALEIVRDNNYKNYLYLTHLTPIQVLKEYRTIRISLSRQCGLTTSVKKYFESFINSGNALYIDSISRRNDISSLKNKKVIILDFVSSEIIEKIMNQIIYANGNYENFPIVIILG